MTENNALIDRQFRHMAWANQWVLELLSQAEPEALAYCAPGSDWSVARIAAHLVDAAGFYAGRLDGQGFLDYVKVPETGVELTVLAEQIAGADLRLRDAAQLPEGVAVFTRDSGEVVQRARSTILAQSIHHATEHRAQIADALAAYGTPLIDLDDLDLWAFGGHEGLGD